ncbi:MAG: T9SS type A sorting domain-containing protein [Bacteroidetes bacterium]|nr:T9SS type A sorting domain-containing protein [Bacteroidota bacterium]
MNRIIYCFISVLFLVTGFKINAQNKRANIWYFGVKAGLDFSTDPPTPLTDGQINTIESAGATICDTSGNLLFYTDGKNVWNRQHKLMTNGTGLIAHQTSTQSAIIVPWPEKDSLYYIFTIDPGSYGGCYWSLVNMNLDSGKGAIVSKNNLILNSVCEKLAATYHANGRDVWIAIHGYSGEFGPFTNDSFYIYLVNENGFQNCPVISPIGVVCGEEDPNYAGQQFGYQAAGQLKFSANGKILLSTVWGHTQDKVEVFDFNRVTGKIERLRNNLYTRHLPYGVEIFDNYVYVTTVGNYLNFYQFDLARQSDDSINFHAQIIDQVFSANSWFSGLQRGVDDRIYVTLYNTGYSAAVENPDTLGINVNFNKTFVYLDGKIANYGFPAFISNYTYSEEPPFNYKIRNDSVYVRSFIGHVNKWQLYKDSILIDSSIAINPIFKLDHPGIYFIKMGKYERELLYEEKIINGNDTIVCDQDSLLITANDNYHCVYWNDTLYNSSFVAYQSGTYKVSGLDGYGNYIIDSVRVSFIKSPSFSLGKDTVFCGNSSIVLNGASKLYKHLWNTGDTSFGIVVTKAGLYSLMEFNNICTYTDSITINIFPIPHPLIAVSGGVLNVSPSYKNFQWYQNNQAITGAKASQFIASQAGNYFIEVVDSNGCVGNSDTVSLNLGVEQIGKFDLRIYPNPVQKFLTIDASDMSSWELNDITGRTILNGTSKSIDFSLLPSSLYILKINGENNHYNHKILKQ